VRVGVHLPQYGPAAGPESIGRAAVHGEELGFADVWVSDHVVHPAEQEYPTPYLYDPLVTLTWAAARTTAVGLGTSVLIVPMHNPLELANALASLDALSGGRLVVGAGVGWSEAEYRALGYGLHDRGRRMDESLDLLRVAWRDDPVSFQGDFFSVENVRVLPKPAHPIPIWVGGTGEAAYQRAVQRGDGFHAVGLKPPQAAVVAARIRSERPELTFTISTRTGWDPQGMDPGVIREERDGRV
jgi:probable F420-dependent oxidoreductase